MGLRDLFAKNPNIIINTDIDGILSGVLLVKYLGCRIVGFSNSQDKVWLADDHDDLYKHVYIDMFVTDDRVLCVDQHIVAINAEHQQRIIQSGTKYSPQIEGNRIFTKKDFENKYPFGTTQYIIASLEEEGITVELPPLTTSVPNSNIKVGDLVHRADDAMRSTLYNYVKNSKYWWQWLKDKSGDAQSICSLIDYLLSIPETTGHKMKKSDEGMKRYMDDVKKKTGEFFKSNFLCSKDDGDFKEITDESGNVLDSFQQYVSSIGNIINCPGVVIPAHYKTHTGKAYRTRWLDFFEKDFLKDYTFFGHRIFSYAFLYSPDNDRYTNWSFTVDME